MDPESWEQVELVFGEALELPPSERRAFVAAAGLEPELRDEVWAMLAAHEEEASLPLEHRSREVDRTASLLLGRQFGPHRLERLIGKGGMGEVYLAHRSDDSFRQRVAIKVVRTGGLPADRFLLERQILARLVHPNIAVLHDGGISEEGYPYLVMEYVDGLPITEYCDEHRLSIEERLRLFVRVCETVQFAHNHLVVHRDLKPSNMLVTEAGEVKLLDFGIAKLLDPRSLELSMEMTAERGRLLTPLRAAPEQLLGEPVTTATDVYALGLLLYEILVGRLPYAAEAGVPLALERAICRDEPIPPSVALDLSTEDTLSLSAEDLSARRRTEPARLRRTLRGDLERILLMALRKEAERRYSSAGQLGEDVERYLAGQPVLARPDSWSYRARKFVRRNRIPVAAAALFALALVAFSTVTAWQARVIAAERDRAAAERDRAEEVAGMLADLFRETSPVEGSGGETVAVDDLLAIGVQRIESLESDPELQARMNLILGQIQRSRSRLRQAHELLLRSYAAFVNLRGEEDPEAMAAQHELGLVALALGELDEARARLRRSLELHRQRFGEENLDVAQAMQDLAPLEAPAERLRLLEGSLAVRRRLMAEGSVGMASGLNALGMAHVEDGRPSNAVPLFQEALAILEQHHGERHPHTLAVMNNLAMALGDPVEEEKTRRRLIELQRELVGDDSEGVANGWNNLGVALLRQGRREEAEEAFREARGRWRRLAGEDHPQVGNVSRNLGWTLFLERRYDEAVAELELGAELLTRALGEQDPGAALARAQAAAAAARVGREEQAERWIREAVDNLRRTDGSLARRNLASALHFHGTMLLEGGEDGAALEALREAAQLDDELGQKESLEAARCTLAVALAARAEALEPELAQSCEAVAGSPLADPWLLDRIRSSGLL